MKLRMRGALVYLLVILVVVASVIVPSAAAATARQPSADQPADPAAVRAFFDEVVPAQLDAHHVPGAAVVAVTSRQEVFAGGYGVADAATGRRVDPERTMFPIDSVTKLVTATAVMQLVERGLVDLDTDVNRYLDGIDIRTREPVTLAHLLTHTAGFEEQAIGILPTSPDDVGPLASELAADQPAQIRSPGTYAGYSNYGVALAGLVVEQRSGMVFEDYVAHHILRPLTMERSGFLSTLPAPLRRDLAVRHRAEGDRQVGLPETGDRQAPAGGMVATATDMGRFMRAHLADGHLAEGRLEGTRILDAGTASDMHQRQFAHDPRLPGIAVGFVEHTVAGTHMITHGGDGLGSHGVLWLAPDQDLGVYVVVNGDGTDDGGFAAVDEIAEQFMTRFAASESAVAASAQGSSPDAAQLAGTYRATRISHSDFTELVAALATDVSVTANADGTLTTVGLIDDSSAEAQLRWEPIGDKLFRQRDGQRLLAFSEHALFDGDDPTIAYERLASYQLPGLHLAVAAGGLLMLVTTVVWPVTWMIRRLRGTDRPQQPAGARVARLVALVTLVLIIAFMVNAVLLASDLDRFVTVVVTAAPVLRVMFAPIWLAALSTLTVLTCALLAWRRGWWRRPARLHYTAVAAGAVMFMAIAHTYQFVFHPLG